MLCAAKHLLGVAGAAEGTDMQSHVERMDEETNNSTDLGE
jgi:hypothetical protein